MSIAYVTKQSLTPVICSPNSAEMAAGDLVRLALNTAVVPEFPVDIIGVVQPPVRRVAMLDPIGGCRVVGYEYDISFTVEDLLGAAVDLTADLILSMGCVTCCQILDERLLAERAERIAFDDGVRTLTLTGPPVNGVVHEIFLSFNGETVGPVGGNLVATFESADIPVSPLTFNVAVVAGYTEDDIRVAFYAALQANVTGFDSLFSFTIDGPDTTIKRKTRGPDATLSVLIEDPNELMTYGPLSSYTLVTGVFGTTAFAVGQKGVFFSDGGNYYTFRCVTLLPVTWEGATPLLAYNPDIPRWSIGRYSGPDGAESLTTGPLV